MTVKDIIKTAILLTGRTELLGLNTFSTTSQTSPTTVQQSDIDLYVQCFNFAYKEIANSYFPLLHKESITFSDNKFLFSGLSKTIISIKKLSKSRKNLKYYIYPDHIFCETDKANIVYSYLPDDMAITATVNLFGGRVLPQVMAYGVAREFCFINGDFSSADVWESKFKQGLHASYANKLLCNMPRRRFL